MSKEEPSSWEHSTPTTMQYLTYWLLDKIPHVTIRREGGVAYMTRYYLLGGPAYTEDSKSWIHRLMPFNIFLHCFHASDEATPHNHPWKWAVSFICAGRYREFRPTVLPTDGNENVRDFKPGDINIIRAGDFHHVELLTDRVWTLFIHGKRIQHWGFFTDDNGFEPWEKFIARKPGSTTTGKLPKNVHS